MLQIVLTYFVCIGGFLAFLLAVQQVIAQKRELANFLRSFLLMVSSIVLYGYALFANKVCLEYPILVFMYFTSAFLLGPMYLFTINSLLGIKKSMQKIDILHFIPAVTVFIGEIIFQLQDPAFKLDVLRVFLTTPTQSPLVYLLLAAIASNMAYEFAVVKSIFEFWTNQEIKREVRIIGVRLGASVLSLSLFTVGMLLANPLLILSGGTVHTGIIVSMFITQDYYPQFFFALKEEIRRKRYEHSLLQGLNTDIIKNRLEEIMNDEQVYKDMDLNLQTLAARLSMTQHQLSQFLNEQMKANFRNYVNGYRVREAMRLLAHNEKLSISSICYEVGFNSKSTFYTVFKEVTGKTPREIRDEIQSKA
jgi:AraC-like DNA-binding protein